MIKKRVVFLRSNPVQPDPRVEKEVSCLLKADYKVTVLAWDRSKKYKVKKTYLNLENRQAELYRFGIPACYGGGMKKNLKPLILFEISIIRWLLRYKNEYDIIHACDFDTAYVACKCAKILNKKIIYDIFDYYVDSYGVPNKLKKIIKNMDHRVINFADGVIICTEKRKEQIKGSNPKRLTIVHNSPPVLDFNNSFMNLNREKIKIVYVGVLLEGRLLKELANVIINNSNLELHIGGFGKLDEYFKNLSSKYDNIFYYGKLEYKKTIELEVSCDIMTAIYDPAVPNHHYAAPNKFYEALMLGKPVIMVKNTGMDDVISKNKIGEIIEYNSISLQKGIENLINRKQEWTKISNTMQKIYKENYNWDCMEKRIVDLYKNI